MHSFNLWIWKRCTVSFHVFGNYARLKFVRTVTSFCTFSRITKLHSGYLTKMHIFNQCIWWERIITFCIFIKSAHINSRTFFLDSMLYVVFKGILLQITECTWITVPSPTRNKFLFFCNLTKNLFRREYVEWASNSNTSVQSTLYSKRIENQRGRWVILKEKKQRWKTSRSCCFRSLWFRPLFI